MTDPNPELDTVLLDYAAIGRGVGCALLLVFIGLALLLGVIDRIAGGRLFED